MEAVSNTTLTNASGADIGSAQGFAAVAVLRKSLDQQASAAAQLIAALPQLPLASSGPVGTRINTLA